ncbi:MAG: DUF1570 domain-containing protein [Planctomycetota bacterium]|nr:DUF1570 domain-containing protein [Planctomycetota bacterium]
MAGRHLRPQALRQSLRLAILVAISLVLGSSDSTSFAQTKKNATTTASKKGDPPRPISPREMGLELPDEGAVRQGEGRRVTLKDKDGNQVVAKVHLDIADTRVVLMPNGSLQSVDEKSTTPTSADFVPKTKKEIAADLKKEFPDFQTKITPHYVFVYNCSKEFSIGTSSILESMYPGLQSYLRRVGLKVQEPETPLVVIMFKTREQFDALHPMPEGVGAYYDGVSNHVVLYEQSDLTDAAPELALRQAISTIAHEGVHQILHNNGVQKRLSRWPMWIAEGLPEYLAPTIIDVNNLKRTLKWRGAGTVNDLRMYELERLYKHDASIIELLVKRTIAAPELDSPGYAASWALTHYLSTRQRDKFASYLKEVSKIEPLHDRAGPIIGRTEPAEDDVFTEHFGDDRSKLAQAMLEHLKKLPYKDPIVNQTFYVVTMAVRQGRTTAISAGLTTSPAAVREWQQQAQENLPAPLRASSAFSIRTFPNKVLADTFLNNVMSR